MSGEGADSWNLCRCLERPTDSLERVPIWLAVINVARGEGYAFATCTIADGGDAERRVWEALGAELRDAGEGRLHPVLSL